MFTSTKRYTLCYRLHLFFHSPLSLFCCFALKTQYDSAIFFNSALHFGFSQLDSLTFYFTVFTLYRFRWTRILLPEQRLKWISANDLKSITIPVNNRFDLVSMLFKYVFWMLEVSKWTSVAISKSNDFFLLVYTISHNRYASILLHLK